MIRNLRHALNSLAERKLTRINQVQRSYLLLNNRTAINLGFVRTKKDDVNNKSSLFRPVPIKATEDDINVGEEITGGSLDKAELLKILNKFSQKREVRLLCIEHGLDRKS
jgi:ATP-dependent RNA helicase SUPV3L1/SUV3